MTEQQQPSPDYLAAFRAMRDTANRVLGTISTHQHDWEIMDTWRPTTTTPIHPRMQGGIPQTIVLIICKICHLPETTALDEVWTTEQVRGMASEQPSQPGDEQ